MQHKIGTRRILTRPEIKAGFSAVAQLILIFILAGSILALLGATILGLVWLGKNNLPLFSVILGGIIILCMMASAFESGVNSYRDKHTKFLDEEE